jgi:hypothetical protein
MFGHLRILVTHYLTVYVSCKNWDRDVDRSVLDHEFGGM